MSIKYTVPGTPRDDTRRSPGPCHAAQAAPRLATIIDARIKEEIQTRTTEQTVLREIAAAVDIAQPKVSNSLRRTATDIELRRNFVERDFIVFDGKRTTYLERFVLDHLIERSLARPGAPDQVLRKRIRKRLMTLFFRNEEMSWRSWWEGGGPGAASKTPGGRMGTGLVIKQFLISGLDCKT